MASRRKKPTQLSEREIAEFIEAAEQFHRLLCRPLISPQCGHYRALAELNEAVHAAVRSITGSEPPRLVRGSLRPYR